MKKYVALGCALVAAVALYLTFFRTSDEERIKKVLTTLAQTIEVKDGDNVLTRTARIRGGMKDIVDDDIHVTLAERNIDLRGRHAFEEEASRVAVFYQKASCDFSNYRLRIDPALTTATVDTDAVVTASSGGQQQRDRRAVHFLLRKDGDWKITTIDVAEKQPSN